MRQKFTAILLTIVSTTGIPSSVASEWVEDESVTSFKQEIPPPSNLPPGRYEYWAPGSNTPIHWNVPQSSTGAGATTPPKTTTRSTKKSAAKAKNNPNWFFNPAPMPKFDRALASLRAFGTSSIKGTGLVLGAAAGALGGTPRTYGYYGSGYSAPPYSNIPSGGRVSYYPPSSGYGTNPLPTANATPYAIPQAAAYNAVPNAMNQTCQLMNLAGRARDKGKLDEARRLYEQACATTPNPNSASAQVNASIVCNEQGDFKSALQHLHKALDYDPNNEPARMNLTYTFQSVGQIDLAIDSINRFLSEHPQSAHCAEMRTTLQTLQSADLGTGTSDSPDYFDSATHQNGPVHWAANRMPLRVFITSGQGTRGWNKSYQHVFLTGLDAWIRAAGPSLSWQPCYDESTADIVCRWSDSTAREMSGREGGHCITSQGDSGNGPEIHHADITIYTVNFDGKADRTDVDIRKTCLHELGHSFGLRSHSPNCSDIMFFSISPAQGVQLTERDAQTIRRLYQS